MKKLPIGLQSFQALREGNYLYIDKTQNIFQIIQDGKYYFLSRPRRFGKSLLLSTLKELFGGNRNLFQDLWVEKQWDWTKQNPVLHFSFNDIGHKELGLEKALDAELEKLASEQQVKLNEQGIGRKFRELIQKVAEKGKVVILIDEYDKPIIDFLGTKTASLAYKNQETLKTFYSVIKNSDLHIKFLLITGISKFSKVGVFSDLNNLEDLSTDPRFSSGLGYTQAELESYFEDRILKISKEREMPIPQLLAKIKTWYNGYSWDGKTFVYNPFSVLNFMKRGTFQNYWFSSGTPTFLINLLKERFYYDFNGVDVGASAFESYDISKLETVPLLFQTGYLTIKKQIRNIFQLGYPNQEVKESMLQHLIGAFRYDDASKSAAVAYYVEKAFIDGDLTAVIQHINAMFSSIPYHLFEGKKESYYHSLIHLLFTYLGIYIQSEVNTSKGRADAVVETPDRVYILEFKLDKSVAEAISQIKERAYADKYRNSTKTVLAVGINFSSKLKQVAEWESEQLKDRV